jgi:hypothetical protein
MIILNISGGADIAEKVAILEVSRVEFAAAARRAF